MIAKLPMKPKKLKNRSWANSRKQDNGMRMMKVNMVAHLSWVESVTASPGFIMVGINVFDKLIYAVLKPSRLVTVNVAVSLRNLGPQANSAKSSYELQGAAALPNVISMCSIDVEIGL
jgi:hypothetical protein